MTILVLFLNAIGLFFTARQLSLNNKSRRMGAMNIFSEKVGKTSFRRILREEVYSLTIDQVCALENPSNRWQRKKRDRVEKVISSLDEVGRMAINGVLEKNILFIAYATTIIRCWHRLRYYVKFRRNRDSPLYVRDFETIAKECIVWWLNHGLGTIDPNDASMPIKRDEMLHMLEETLPRPLQNSRFIVLGIILPGNAWTYRAWATLTKLSNRIPPFNRLIQISRIPVDSNKKR